MAPPLPFTPSPAYARLPARRRDPDDPRFLDLLVDDPSDAGLLLAGVPFDGAVIGRKGACHGPQAIRESFRYLGAWDPDHATALRLPVHDLGDVPVHPTDTLGVHRAVRGHLVGALADRKPLVVLGGDNSLSFPTFEALHEVHGGTWGLVVVDAHYDLRPYQDVPNSGTSYRRILTEVPGAPVAGRNLVEIGIRAYANSTGLARYAKEQGLGIYSMGTVRKKGIEAVVAEALQQAGQGVDHLFLSVDIDALDQSIAPGCSAPGAGGLTFEEAAFVVRAVALDSRTRAMDLVEVAPNLDPTGNTARTAAQLVATFAGAVGSRTPPAP